jgi:hypothetical protein
MALLPKQLFLHVSYNSLSFVSIAFTDDGAQQFPTTRFKGDKNVGFYGLHLQHWENNVLYESWKASGWETVAGSKLA